MICCSGKALVVSASVGSSQAGRALMTSRALMIWSPQLELLRALTFSPFDGKVCPDGMLVRRGSLDAANFYLVQLNDLPSRGSEASKP